MRSRQAAIALSAILAGSLVALLVLDLSYDAKRVSEGLEFLPVIRVYKNGQLVYEKIGDPPLENWAKAIAAILSDKGQTLIDSAGIGRLLRHGDYNDAFVGRDSGGHVSQPPVIVVGRITSDITRSLYWFDEAYTFDATALTIGWADNGDYVIKLKGVFSPDKTITINAVGLAIRPVIDSSYRVFLVFADKLQQEITLTNTDSLTVVYEIRIKWPTGGSG